MAGLAEPPVPQDGHAHTKILVRLQNHDDSFKALIAFRVFSVLAEHY